MPPQSVLRSLVLELLGDLWASLWLEAISHSCATEMVTARRAARQCGQFQLDMMGEMTMEK